MRAIAYDSFGHTDVLRLVDLPEPKLGPDSVLVRVRAAGVNPVDWKAREGELDPIIDTQFPVVPGWDLAGVVERVPPSVPEYTEGDEVVGYVREDWLHHGTCAELVAAPLRSLARKPKLATWEQAGGLPLAGLTAYQSLRAVSVGVGDVVLVHAAAGGVGSLGVQIARSLGARVIGTASQRNHEFVRSLGAEPVTYGDGLIEQVRELAPDGVDAVVDFVGGGVLVASVDLLRAGSTPRRMATIIDPQSAAGLGARVIWARADHADLELLADWVDAGKLVIPVERTFPLAEVAAAHELSETGHVRGKIVITL